MAESKFGGWSEVKAPTPEIGQIVKDFKEQVLKAAREQRQEKDFLLDFNVPWAYCEQIVDGKNYRILIQANPGDYLVYEVHVPQNDPKNAKLTKLFENCLTLAPNTNNLGGWSKEQDPTDEIFELVYKVRSQVEGKLQTRFREFQALTFVSAVTTGVKYRVLVKTLEPTPIVFDFLVPPYEGAKPELIDVLDNYLIVDITDYRMTPAVKYEDWSEEKEATQEIQDLIDQVKSEVQASTDKKLSKYKALIYATQFVGVMNYRILIEIDELKFLAIQLYKESKDAKPKLSMILENSLTMNHNNPPRWIGMTDEQEVADHQYVNKLVDIVRPEVETKNQIKYSIFKPLQFCNNSMFYRVRIQIDATKFLLIKFTTNFERESATLSRIFENSLSPDENPFAN